MTSPKKKAAKKVAAMLRQSSQRSMVAPGGDVDVPALVRDLGGMIDAARKQVAITADATLATLYWEIGHRVHADVLEGRRAEYGGRIVAAVGQQLDARYGRGFGVKNLHRMVQFSSVFPDAKIVAALLRHLGWTHFTMLIPIKDALKRDFYAEMCRIEKWNTRTLEKKIGSMLFERTALSKKPDKLIRQELAALRADDRLTPDLVFRDPYVLDFLRLHDTYAEQDIEAAILREMESFILTFTSVPSGISPAFRGTSVTMSASISCSGVRAVSPGLAPVYGR